MEDCGWIMRPPPSAARLLAVGLVAGCALAWAIPLSAEPLSRRIPALFGGSLTTTTSHRETARTEAQQLLLAELFSTLSADLAVFYSEAPIPSASGAFRFRWSPELETFERIRKGPGLADRAQTLGWHVGTFSVSYTHTDFDTVEGDSLRALRSVQPALSKDYLAPSPPPEQERAGDDLLTTRLALSLTLDQVFVAAAYGITDSLDASVALSINHVRMKATAEAQILDPDGDNEDDGAFFVRNQPGVCSDTFRCARDGFDDSAAGTGDIFLRIKWHFYDTTLADLAVAGVLTLPTGNADELLGFHDPTFTPWLIASKDFRRLSPHVNLGYAFRSSEDVSQALWIAGSDWRVFDRLTLTADFLGFHDDNRDGINDDVIQSAVGFKVNPLGNLAVSGYFQFPLNSDGLRADVIYTGQVEYTF